jgi:hypothetical protein
VVLGEKISLVSWYSLSGVMASQQEQSSEHPEPILVRANQEQVKEAAEFVQKILSDPYDRFIGRISLAKIKKISCYCPMIEIAAPPEFIDFLIDVIDKAVDNNTSSLRVLLKALKVLVLFGKDTAFTDVKCTMTKDELLALLRTKQVIPDLFLVYQMMCIYTFDRPRFYWYEWFDRTHHGRFAIRSIYAVFLLYDYQRQIQCGGEPMLYASKHPPVDMKPHTLMEQLRIVEKTRFLDDSLPLLILNNRCNDLSDEDKFRIIQIIMKWLDLEQPESQTHKKLTYMDIKMERAKKEEEEQEMERQANVTHAKEQLVKFFNNFGVYETLVNAVFLSKTKSNGGLNVGGKGDRGLRDMAELLTTIWCESSLPNGATRPQLERWFQLNWRKILWTKMLNAAVRNKMSQSS